MKRTNIVVLILLFIIIKVGFGQNNCSNIKILGPSNIYPIKPLPKVDERDVMWHRRLWREINLNDKPNDLLRHPKNKENCSFFDVVYSSLRKGSIKAYHPKNDEFSEKHLKADFDFHINTHIISKNGFHTKSTKS